MSNETKAAPAYNPTDDNELTMSREARAALALDRLEQAAESIADSLASIAAILKAGDVHTRDSGALRRVLEQVDRGAKEAHGKCLELTGAQHAGQAGVAEGLTRALRMLKEELRAGGQ